MRACTTLTFLSTVALIPNLVIGQLTGPVGPTTTVSDKSARKICNVLDYGAVADKKTDLGPALADAHFDCVRTAGSGVVYIPEGDYAMETWVTLNGGEGWALQLDGIIYRTGTSGGNMILVKRTNDFELFSSTGKGAIQGNGYEFHADNGNLGGPRILRLTMVNNFSVHDIALADAPSFHYSIDTCTNGEIYNMAIRGGDSGGLDAIDVWGENIWIHDVMATNKDECICVKNPSHNMLIENIYCNWSGGSAFGSLAKGINISDITYRNVYTYHSNQMMMIKSNGGNGTVSNVLLESFIGRSNAYSLDIDQYWSSMNPVEGDGVFLNNFTITNWKGTCENGKQRGPVKVACADGAPCTDIKIDDFEIWTETGDILNNYCQSAYGTGFCLKNKAADPSAYKGITYPITVEPKNYAAPTMSEDLEDNFGFTIPIPIPTIPASFFPDTPPISPLAGSVADKIVKSYQPASLKSTTTTTFSPTTTPVITTSTTLIPTTTATIIDIDSFTTTVLSTTAATPTESRRKQHRHHRHHDKKERHQKSHHLCNKKHSKESVEEK
ncbi:pectin lyase fold/virulence factor [Phascolomyces articulosus]|uniref:Pectin lyase fold/virulence factor n=1 Tax=Phascolomyces articulosus TaxID=60185 RepID=A0AAD5KE30_9FUNG|nr:pectin lyase fold/virulence factor [Phascolomyces articulosus]